MREFPQDALASRLLAHNAISAADIDALAAKVAAFHATVAVAPPAGACGRPEVILRIALDNFSRLAGLATDPATATALAALRAWTEGTHRERTAAFRERLAHGFIRECHGDLHLGNIARIDGELTVFDCIEFNDTMRWIDVISEVAFTVMDLQDRGRPDFAHRFLNAYLELTGDYAGLSVLGFYLVYRAMVRAKVAAMRIAQVGPAGDAAALREECRGYIELAQADARPPRPAIIIAHGLSGSGKSTLTQALLELTGAVRIRTDVERKRMHALQPRERPGAGIGRGLYAKEATEAAYRRVDELAGTVAAAGRVAIVDATFLKRWQRDLLRARASALGIPFLIVAFTAAEAALRERVARRAREGGDASDADVAVLAHQMRELEPLAPDEQACAVAWDAGAPLARAREPDAWRAVLERLAAPAGSDIAPGAKATA
jgi:predicted kinase